MTQAHTLWLIFVVALIVRLTYTLGLYLGMGNDALLAEDSILYLELGQEFVAHGDFVRFYGDGRGFEPETERMPLYVI